MTPTDLYPDPIQFLYSKFGFDYSKVKKIVFGEKYVAILLITGDIGLCATLNHIPAGVRFSGENIDLENITHRVILNAYYNALINPHNQYDQITDIFDKIDFGVYSNIIMIGYFQSLVKKLDNEKIPLTIFDSQKTANVLHPMDNQLDIISKADAIILTGTSIFNKTFTKIVNRAKYDCDMFLLGPSSIMYPDFLEMYHLKIIFGMTHKKMDNRLLEMVENGHGTPSFKAFTNKVFIIQ